MLHKHKLLDKLFLPSKIDVFDAPIMSNIRRFKGQSAFTHYKEPIKK